MYFSLRFDMLTCIKNYSIPLYFVLRYVSHYKGVSHYKRVTKTSLLLMAWLNLNLQCLALFLLLSIITTNSDMLVHTLKGPYYCFIYTSQMCRTRNKSKVRFIQPENSWPRLA